MIDARAIYKQVYQTKPPSIPLLSNPFTSTGRRDWSFAVVGGALGDEGKGRITDEITAEFLKQHQSVIHYRDNGGANAGHTIEIGEMRLALHQLSSGVTQAGCEVVLGKEMVIHPDDLVLEMEEVLHALGVKKLPATLHLDEQAFLCLDTHRAFEVVLKAHSTGSLGSTGRGISPAYADIVYRHPLQMRDLASADWQDKLRTHYELYQAWVSGFGYKLDEVEVPRLDRSVIKLGTVSEFLARLEIARERLLPFIEDVSGWLEEEWGKKTPFVFEKAQALGLDRRWGVYPDVTASDCSFDGILSSTEGIVDPDVIAVRAATIKATYSSSVGTRVLPTQMPDDLAHRIREDANEYGATTRRPRGIAYIDIPMLSFLFRVGRVEYLTVTHLDVSYLDVPIKVCVGYTKDGKPVSYRPDQAFLDTVTPEYIELPSWDGAATRAAKTPQDLPKAAQQYLEFLSQCLNAKHLLATTGPKREQTVRWY
jgi:adenylosuccinate synthase